MAISLKKISFHDVGIFDMRVLIDNFETLCDGINDLIRLRDKDVDNFMNMYPAHLSYAVDAFGDHTVLGKTVRAEMKVSQIYIVAGADGDDTTVDVTVDGQPLCEPIKLKATESRGKIVIGDIFDYPTITRFDEVIVTSSSNRRVAVAISFKGCDE